MNEVSLKEIKEEVKLYAKWFNEHHQFIKQIFDYEELRQPIESIPSLLYQVSNTIMNATSITEDVEYDASLLIEGSSYLADVIDIYEFVYNSKKDIKLLLSQSELFSLLFLAQDLLDFISNLPKYNNLKKDSDRIGNLVSEISDLIYQGTETPSDLLQDGYNLIDEITGSLSEDDSFVPMEYFFEELSLERNIPLINLDKLEFVK